MTTIKQLAEKLDVAEIRVWEMIRKKIITSSICAGIVMVDSSEAEEYLKEHPALLKKWQRDYRHCQTYKIVCQKSGSSEDSPPFDSANSKIVIKSRYDMDGPKKKRRGGVYDDSEVYINYSRKQLMIMLRLMKRRTAKYRMADRRLRIPRKSKQSTDE